MKDRFEISYVTTLPKLANAPRVSIFGQENKKYYIKGFESIADYSYVIFEGVCHTNETLALGIRQSYTQWGVEIRDEEGNFVFKDWMDLENKTVFIKMDAYALGDTIAWIPYVEAFRLKHDCKVICSSFHNDLLVTAYPNIMFVKPNTVINNIYAQYYIGAANDGDLRYSPIKVNDNPLQMVASSILGMIHEEIRPDLTLKYAHIPSRFNYKYVTLSEYGSTPNKHWKAENGWQGVVDYLNEKGFKVVVISKEKTSLTGVIDMSGEYSLDDRAVDIMHGEFHLGVSSGLSWLAWALGKHTVMISDVTPNWHEFGTDITRVNANDLSSVNYLAEGQSSLDNVLKTLAELVNARYL